MSKISPNNNCQILIDDFINLAKQHMLSIKGQAVCNTQFANGAILPSIASWEGYSCDPETPDEIEIPNVETQFKGTNELTLEEIEYYKEDLQQIYATDYPDEVNNAPIYGGRTTNSSTVANTSFVASGAEARRVAENYLGRPMSDQEWNFFIALVFAEAGRYQPEEAHVAATILNRVRFKFTPLGLANKRYKFDTVMDIANQKLQYEAVTGNPANGYKPSRWFLQGPSKSAEVSIYGGIVNIMPGISKRLTDFTSNNDCLYVQCRPPKRGLQDVIRPIQRIRGRNYDILTSRRVAPYNGFVVGSTIFSVSQIIVRAGK